MTLFVAPDAISHETDSGTIQLPSAAADERWQTARAVPFRLTITLPLPGLKLRSLRALCAGTLFSSATPAENDLPVTVAGAMLGWGELHSLDGRMALRLTRLA